MATLVRCGRLFTGLADEAAHDQTIVVRDGVIASIGPTAAAPTPAAGDTVVDHSRHFVMPGLIDGHTHLGSGNAMTEEDMDIYAPLEFRALRTLVNAQRLFGAGYTGAIDGGCAGRVALAVRNAIDSGMFAGPRLICSGGFLTTRLGAPNLYPNWFKNPYSLCELVTTMDGAIESIRAQVKDGVDFIKLGFDGRQRNFEGGLAACFSESEAKRLIDECHRLGKWVKVHAKGTEGMIYAARAGAEVICHAADVTDQVVDEVLKARAILCPELTIIYTFTCFTQPTDSYFDFIAYGKGEWDRTIASMRKAHAAGIPILAGSDSGYACCPAGEWHALEIKLLVDHAGLTPAQGLRAGTSLMSPLFGEGCKTGTLAPGYVADAVAFEGDPLADINVILDKGKVRGVYRGGERVATKAPPISPRTETEFSYRMWQRIYDQKTIAALAAENRIAVR